jgi:predicted dehydrogenase
MKLAVVGCGAVSEYFHLPAIVRTRGRDDLWLVDADLERARELARSFGRAGRVAEDATEVTRVVDAAIVALPNDLHAPVASRLLAAGVHVLCEKPLARTAAEGRAIAGAARPGTVLAVGQFRRFFPSVRLVADLLRAEVCGRPLRFEAEEGIVYSWGSRSGYALDRERAGGGVLLDLGSHVLDQLLLWLGALELRSYADDAHGGLEADCRLELGAEGTEGTVELSRTRELAGAVRIECERGALHVPLSGAGAVRVSFADGRGYELEADRVRTGADRGYAAAFDAQLRDFLDAVEQRREPEASAADALRVLELVDACYARREPLPEPWVFEALSS